MKLSKRLRNIFISLVSMLGIVWVYRTLARRHGPLVRILCFHDVKNGTRFRNTIEHLNQHYNVLSPNDFFTGNFDQKQINVLLTFDDGYESWVTRCAPILKEHNIKGLFFVNSALLDAHADNSAQEKFVQEKLMLKPKKTLSWEGLIALQKAGHEIGGHSRSHERLSTLPAEVQKKEILEDKRHIEAVLQKSIRAFAYPFGNKSDYSEETITALEEVGYQYAFTACPRFYRHQKENKFTLPRLCLERKITPRRLDQWVRGGYDLYKSVKNF